MSLWLLNKHPTDQGVFPVDEARYGDVSVDSDVATEEEESSVATFADGYSWESTSSNVAASLLLLATGRAPTTATTAAGDSMATITELLADGGDSKEEITASNSPSSNSPGSNNGTSGDGAAVTLSDSDRGPLFKIGRFGFVLFAAAIGIATGVVLLSTHGRQNSNKTGYQDIV